MTIPTPGSPEARERGCTCPVGQPSTPPPWTVDGACPLHGYGASGEERKLRH